MDNQNNNFKGLDLSSLPKMDLIKDIKVDLTKLPDQTQFISPLPKITIPKKEEPKPKKGIEGWYERNTGKITLFFAGLSALLAILAIYQGYLLSQ